MSYTPGVILLTIGGFGVTLGDDKTFHHEFDQLSSSPEPPVTLHLPEMEQVDPLDVVRLVQVLSLLSEVSIQSVSLEVKYAGLGCR